LTEYLLDTDHLSFLEGTHPRVLARLSEVGTENRVVTSVVNFGEVLLGVALLPEGKRRNELLERCRQVLGQMQGVLQVSLSAAQNYAGIAALLQRKGRPIPVNDMWIAAVALSRGAVLVTSDAHFAHVDGLRTEDWT